MLDWPLLLSRIQDVQFIGSGMGWQRASAGLRFEYLTSWDTGFAERITQDGGMKGTCLSSDLSLKYGTICSHT